MKRFWRIISTWTLVYLPVLLMLVLALGSFWLLRQTPAWSPPKEAVRLREIPDIIVSGVQLRSFDEAGALQTELKAQSLLRYQASGIAELKEVQIHSRLLSGGEVQASAARARANSDMTEVQLIGGADMLHTAPESAPASLNGDFLHFFIDQERVESHLPVFFARGKDTFQVGSLRYDQLRGTLNAAGGVRAVLDPAD